MGYRVNQRGSKFSIRKENFEKALLAVKGLVGQKTVRDFETGSFDDVDDNFGRAKTLEEALAFWRWKLMSDTQEIEFTGKVLGDDKLLFHTIAPYVEEGSYIKMEGEDGVRWKWAFDGKRCIEKFRSVVYEA